MRFKGIREVEPTAYRVLVKSDPVEEVTKSGIVLAVDKIRERSGIVTGTIVKVGPTAWKDYKGMNGRPWAAVGDRVIFSKYAGAFIDDGSEDGLILVNDEDIQAVVTKEVQEVE